MKSLRRPQTAQPYRQISLVVFECPVPEYVAKVKPNHAKPRKDWMAEVDGPFVNKIAVNTLNKMRPFSKEQQREIQTVMHHIHLLAGGSLRGTRSVSPPLRMGRNLN